MCTWWWSSATKGLIVARLKKTDEKEETVEGKKESQSVDSHSKLNFNYCWVILAKLFLFKACLENPDLVIVEFANS